MEERMFDLANGRLETRGVFARTRLPLTSAFIFGTTVLAIATGALSGGTSSSIIDRFGYSLEHLRHGRLYVIPISDWLVGGARHWASMLLLYTLFTAPLEWLTNTGFLARVFFLGSWIGTFVTSLIVVCCSSSLNWHPHPDLVHQADVGGSVGTWSAAGALNVVIGSRFPWLSVPVRIGSAVYLGHQLVIERGAADVAHLLGFGIGTACGLCSAWRWRGDG